MFINAIFLNFLMDGAIIIMTMDAMKLKGDAGWREVKDRPTPLVYAFQFTAYSLQLS